jgi:hypothetical protein
MKGYIIVKYSATIYAKLHLYLTMAMCGRNMSLHLHESLEQVAIEPVLSELH